jgi:hypothetical protein
LGVGSWEKNNQKAESGKRKAESASRWQRDLKNAYFFRSLRSLGSDKDFDDVKPTQPVRDGVGLDDGFCVCLSGLPWVPKIAKDAKKAKAAAAARPALTQ